MKLSGAFVFALLATVCLGLPIRPMAGVKPEGQVCTAPMQCLEPFYCLKVDDTSHACGKKPCNGQGECRIGQYCDGAGFCAVSTCLVDSECSGQTICQVNGKCGTKSTNGQGCHRDAQCWSKTCVDDKCIVKPSTTAATPASSPPAEEEPEATPEDDVFKGAEDVVKRGLKIGGGAIAGISVGLLLLLALCCLCIMCCRRKKYEND